MSLINQMLQDLEKRQPMEVSHGDLGEIKATPLRRPSSVLWKIVAGLLLVLVVGMAWLLWQHQLYKVTDETEWINARAPKPVPIASTKPVVVQTPVAEIPATTITPVVVSLPPPAAIDPKPQVSEKTLQANVVEENKKIVEPKKIAVEKLVPAKDEIKTEPSVRVVEEAPRKVMPTLKEKHKAREQEVGVPQVIQTRDASAANTDINKQMRQLTAQQRAENEFRKASGLLNQGRIEDAIDGYRSALQIYPAHEASRQALLALLVENKRLTEAQTVLQETLQRDVNQPAYAMALARINVEKGQIPAALDVLQATAPYAINNAQYQAFMATLNQRQGKHQEAVEHYQTALRLSPQTGVWWMGAGISLQALNRQAEALEAYNRAKVSGGLTPDLMAFVDQHLKQLQKTVR